MSLEKLEIIAKTTSAGSPETNEPRFMRIYADKTVVALPYILSPSDCSWHSGLDVRTPEQQQRDATSAAMYHAQGMRYDYGSQIDTLYSVAFVYTVDSMPLIDIYGFTTDPPKIDKMIPRRFAGGTAPKIIMDKLGNETYDPSLMFWQVVGTQPVEHPRDISKEVMEILELEVRHINKEGTLKEHNTRHFARSRRGRRLEGFLFSYPSHPSLPISDVYSPSLDHIQGSLELRERNWGEFFQGKHKGMHE